VLRTSAPLNTIGGGVITDPYAPRRARLWPVGLSAGERLLELIDESGGRGVETATLPVRLGVPNAECIGIATDLSDEVAVVHSRLVSRRVLEAIERAIETEVDRYHDANPLEPGVPAQLLRARIPSNSDLVESVLARLLTAGTLTGVAGSVSRRGWTPKLDSGAESLAGTIVSRLTTAGAEPPAEDELEAELGKDVAAVLRYLERSGAVVQVEQGRYYAASQLKSLVDRLRDVMGGGKELSPSEIRDALGLSRKYLIPFLEYCDRVGYTNRNANGRVWRGA
jgi:selenocysteine-specific elongation factor